MRKVYISMIAAKVGIRSRTAKDLTPCIPSSILQANDSVQNPAVHTIVFATFAVLIFLARLRVCLRFSEGLLETVFFPRSAYILFALMSERSTSPRNWALLRTAGLSDRRAAALIMLWARGLRSLRGRAGAAWGGQLYLKHVRGAQIPSSSAQLFS